MKGFRILPVPVASLAPDSMVMLVPPAQVALELEFSTVAAWSELANFSRMPVGSSPEAS